MDRKQYFKEHHKKYYQENKEKCNQITKDWIEKHPEKAIEYYQRRYLKDKEKVLRANKLWAEKNPEKAREIHSDLAKNYRKKYPEKVSARSLASRKLKHLKKEGYEFHHEDYSKPLDIIILPSKEHQLNHRRKATWISQNTQSKQDNS